MKTIGDLQREETHWDKSSSILIQKGIKCQEEYEYWHRNDRVAEQYRLLKIWARQIPEMVKLNSPTPPRTEQ